VLWNGVVVAECLTNRPNPSQHRTAGSSPGPGTVRPSCVIVAFGSERAKPFLYLANIVLNSLQGENGREKKIVTGSSRVVGGGLVSVFGTAVRERVSKGRSDFRESGV
jgi:hypothetical protein